MGKRIVLATLGSLGDLHPLMALAHGLQTRGHTVWIATNTIHQARIEAQGIGWYRMRPEVPENDAALFDKLFDEHTGPQYAVQHIISPAIRDSFDDLWIATKNADVLISSSLALAAPLVAAKRKLAWTSVQFQPLGFLSPQEIPLPESLAVLRDVPGFAAWLSPAIAWAIRRTTRSWVTPVDALRREKGLPTNVHPLWEGQFAPGCILGLFSPVFADARARWLPQVTITGACFFDQNEYGYSIPEDLAAFLAAGPPPIIATLGSAAVQTAKDFFRDVLQATEALGRRAVLIVGNAANRATLPPQLPQTVYCAEYLPYGHIFPHGSLVIHQGGIGTLGQTVRAGKPMIVVPFSYDQPDNAHRVERLGIGIAITRNRLTPERLMQAITKVESSPDMRARVQHLAEKLNQENGVDVACSTLETFFAAQPVVNP